MLCGYLTSALLQSVNQFLTVCIQAYAMVGASSSRPLRTRSAIVRQRGNTTLRGIFGKPTLQEIAALENLKWVVFRGIASVEDTPEDIARSEVELVRAFSKDLTRYDRHIYDQYVRSRDADIDLVVLVSHRLEGQ